MQKSSRKNGETKTVKKRIGQGFSAFRKRMRPVSDVFENIKKKSNYLSKSTENLAKSFSTFRRTNRSELTPVNLDPSLEGYTKTELEELMHKIEKEDEALREMHDLYRYVKITSGDSPPV